MHALQTQIGGDEASSPTSSATAGVKRLSPTRTFAGASLIVLAAAANFIIGGSARAADDQGDVLAKLSHWNNIPKICRHQTYALCAGSSCFIFNNVAYCRCSVHEGKSISAPFYYNGGNVCTVNGAGVDNGYMVSTFSLPPGLATPGDKALYACPRSSRASNARCDGGVCFTSSIGHSFPGSKASSGPDGIVCSCPVEKATVEKGLEIIGPYPCQKDFFDNCNAAFTKTSTGSTLYDGTSIGGTKAAIQLLYGHIPPLNTCPRTSSSDPAD